MAFDQRSLIHREAWFPPCFVVLRIPKNPNFVKNEKNHPKRLEIFQNYRYALRPEVSYPQGSTVSGWSKNTQKPKLFEKRKRNIQNAKTQKRLEICQNQQYPLQPEVSSPSGSVVSSMFCKAKSATTKKLFFARRFQTTFKQKCSHLRPLLSITFPQEFRISQNIGHPSSVSGGKKTFKRYFKSCLVTRYKTVFKASALWVDAFYNLKCPPVCPCVCRLSVC